MLAKVPSALTNPAYITLAPLFGEAGCFLAYKESQMFAKGCSSS